VFMIHTVVVYAPDGSVVQTAANILIATGASAQILTLWRATSTASRATDALSLPVQPKRRHPGSGLHRRVCDHLCGSSPR
jgi:pyruvate/2-oxoglutarate dehydrogenase complex dihydrolipoamide dehydrogenase (E3) component